MNLWPLHLVALIFYVTREIWSSSDGWAHFSLSSDYPLRVLQDIMLVRFTRFLAKCKSFMLLWLLAWRAWRRRDELNLFAPFRTYWWNVFHIMRYTDKFNFFETKSRLKYIFIRFFVILLSHCWIMVSSTNSKFSLITAILGLYYTGSLKKKSFRAMQCHPVGKIEAASRKLRAIAGGFCPGVDCDRLIMIMML